MIAVRRRIKGTERREKGEQEGEKIEMRGIDLHLDLTSVKPNLNRLKEMHISLAVILSVL